jgi:hypothetical protein
MATINASGKVVETSEADDGKITVRIDSARTTDAGVPSFKLSYEFPAGSAASAQYPLDTLVSFAITTTPPVAPAADQITNTASLTSSDAPTAPGIVPEVPETPIEAPVSEPAPEVVEAPVDAPVEADATPLVPESPAP